MSDYVKQRREQSVLERLKNLIEGFEDEDNPDARHLVVTVDDCIPGGMILHQNHRYFRLTIEEIPT
jgi:hypothetical protein